MPDAGNWKRRQSHSSCSEDTTPVMNAPCSDLPVISNLAPTLLPALPVVTPDLPHLPASRAEMKARGWDFVDVVFVTGDAYVDHPAFAMGILGRVLEAAGFRVAILSQPDWRSAEPWRQFGPPRLFFGISAGNMDSMINHYTANKKVRNDDAYSPGGRIGLRPDRATIPYCQRAARHFPACLSSLEGSRPRSAGWPITTTGATPSAARSCSTPRPTSSSSGWASTRSSRSQSDSPPARPSRISERCAAWRTLWGQVSRGHHQPTQSCSPLLRRSKPTSKCSPGRPRSFTRRRTR